MKASRHHVVGCHAACTDWLRRGGRSLGIEWLVIRLRSEDTSEDVCCPMSDSVQPSLCLVSPREAS